MADETPTPNPNPKAALRKTPAPPVQACPFCGSDKVHRHATNPKHLVVTHNEGCMFGRLTVMEEGKEKHQAWEKRA